MTSIYNYLQSLSLKDNSANDQWGWFVETEKVKVYYPNQYIRDTHREVPIKIVSSNNNKIVTQTNKIEKNPIIETKPIIQTNLTNKTNSEADTMMMFDMEIFENSNELKNAQYSCYIIGLIVVIYLSCII